MQKLVAKFAFLLVLLAALLVPAAHFLDQFFSSRFRSEKDFWVMNQKGGEFDFAVLGSSRVYNNVDINEMRRILGGTGINMGVAGTGYGGMQLILNRFYNNGNRIRTLLIQVDIFGFDSKSSYSNPFPVHMYLPFMGSDSDAERIIKEKSSPLDYFLWKQFPFVKYLEFNTEYLKFLFRHIRPKFEVELTGNSGSQLLGEGYAATFRFKNGKRKIVMDDYADLVKIVTLARSHGTTVLMFTSPQFHELYGMISTYPAYSDVLGHVVSRYDIPILAIDDSALSRNRELFVDFTHTNSHGSKLFSRKLAEHLKKYLDEHPHLPRDIGSPSLY